MSTPSFRALPGSADVYRDAATNKSTVNRTHLVSLNFKVPFEFRREFKLFSARRGVSMNQVLREAFAALSREQAGTAEDE